MSEDNPFAPKGGPGPGAKSPSPPRSSSPTPSWLKGASSTNAVAATPSASHAVPIQPATLQPPQTAAAATAAAATAQQAPSGQTPQLVIYMRVANLAMCVLMCVAAILTVIVPAGATPAAWVLAFYVLAFSCLLCCFEFNLRMVAKHIASNFGFLYEPKTRATFLVFVGVLCFSLGITGKIAGACMIVNAIFNLIVLCKYPMYATNAPATTAEQEAAKYLQRNPGLARKVGGAVVNAAVNNNQPAGAGGGGSSSWI